jgi:hypothetical protein
MLSNFGKEGNCKPCSASDDMLTQLLVIANPASRRVAEIEAAVRRVGGFNLDVVSYSDLLSQSSNVLPGPGGIVRLESPGECAETYKQILKAGIGPMESRGRVPIGSSSIDQLTCDRCEMLHPLQWYLGYQSIIGKLESDWADRGIRWMSAPSSIALAFDKLACLELWSTAGLPVPHRYSNLLTYADIRQAVPDRHARLFIKLRYGYSAMGAVALEWRDSRVRAITTVDVTWSQGRPRFFLTKKPRVLQREFEIAWLIDTLGMEEILVEDWLPKARIHNQPFDLRILSIGGSVQHVVGRANDSPFTNLNLDAKRISREDVIQRLGPAWPEAISLTERAAACFPGAGMLGIDLLVRPCRKKFALLEANAFGDYLPGLLFNGRSTYEAQLFALRHAEETPSP